MIYKKEYNNTKKYTIQKYNTKIKIQIKIKYKKIYNKYGNTWAMTNLEFETLFGNCIKK